MSWPDQLSAWSWLRTRPGATFRPNTRLSLALLIGLLALVVQWVAYNNASEMLEATVRRNEVDKFAGVGRVIDGLIQQRARQAQSVAKQLASDPDLALAMRAPQSPRDAVLARTLTDAARTGQVQIVEITNLDEVTVYQTHDPKRFGDSTSGWGLAEALTGRSMLVSNAAPEGVVIWAIEPLLIDNIVVGAVSVGVVMDRPFLNQVGSEAGARLALLSSQGDNLAGATTDALTVDRQALRAAFESKIPVYRIDSDLHQTNGYLPVPIIDQAYVILVQLDSVASFLLFDQNRHKMALWAGLTLVLSVAIALLVLRLALTPLRQLRQRAEQTALQLTGQSIQEPGNDEVASAVKALDTLTTVFIQRNKELVEAQHRADAANQAKSQFLSAMSHEIRTPLNGVLGLAELLSGTQLSSEQRRYVESIDSAGRNLRALLGDVLDLAKIEANLVVLERLDFDPPAVLVELRNLYRDQAAERGLSLVLDPTGEQQAWVNGDPTRLRQILTNLLGNALKFTPHGEIRLRAERTPPPGRDDGRSWWRFTVQDTGVGIATDALGRVFQRFVQADATTTRQFGGSGLGLAVTQQLAQLMGGEIQVRSECGAGSMFWVDLPFELASAPEPITCVAEPLPDSNQFADARILVAEDDPINQLIVESMLLRLGTQVTLVENGELALQRAMNGAFDLILMDCQMPVMDGYGATRSIRQWEQGQSDHSAMTIVALTANAMASDRQACLDAGMNDYLTKPISLAALTHMLGRQLPRPLAVVE